MSREEYKIAQMLTREDEALLFRGKDLLNGIYEIKRHQKELIFQFLIVVGPVFVLSMQYEDTRIFSSIVISGLSVYIIFMYFLLRRELAGIREKMVITWKDPLFAELNNRNLVPSSDKERDEYKSEWHQFYTGTLIYIGVIALFTIVANYFLFRTDDVRLYIWSVLYGVALILIFFNFI